MLTDVIYSQYHMYKIKMLQYNDKIVGLYTLLGSNIKPLPLFIVLILFTHT